MQAIGQAKAVAPIITHALVDAATAKRYLRIDIITHSLGPRTALETIMEIIRLQGESPSPLYIGKISMMAAAVPVAYLADVNKFQTALNAFEAKQSLFSKEDTVLHYAFPAGETAAGESFFSKLP